MTYRINPGKDLLSLKSKTAVPAGRHAESFTSLRTGGG